MKKEKKEKREKHVKRRRCSCSGQWTMISGSSLGRKRYHASDLWRKKKSAIRRLSSWCEITIEMDRWIVECCFSSCRSGREESWNGHRWSNNTRKDIELLVSEMHVLTLMLTGETREKERYIYLATVECIQWCIFAVDEYLWLTLKGYRSRSRMSCEESSHVKRQHSLSDNIILSIRSN